MMERDAAHYNCSYETSASVVMFGQVRSKRIFIDVVGIGVNGDVGIVQRVRRLLNLLVMDDAHIFSLVGHIVMQAPWGGVGWARVG
jgi:ubiquinone biosynthesis protein UbiJ